MTSAPLRIKIVTGSTRPGRFNIQPAQWVANLAQSRTDMQAELLDLADLNLPFLDEPNSPMTQQYTQEHTKQWSRLIEEADGFVFVTPEYNHSVSAVLKNAVDYLYSEWNYKPIVFLSYGSQAGGSRAVEHWRTIAGELKMFDLREQLLLPSYWDHLNERGEYQFTDRHEKAAGEMLDALVFWAEQMREALQVLSAR
jgi:NAD(P)H-dependent FMN reductase